MAAIHQHLRLDDRYESVFDTERGVASQGVGVRVDAGVAGQAVADRDDCPPLGEARTHPCVLDETVAQSIESLGDLLARATGQFLRTRIHLDTRQDARLRQGLGDRQAGLRVLAERLVEEDHAADELRQARGREEAVAVGDPRVGAGVDVDRRETLPDGRSALVRSEDPLFRGNQCLGGVCEA